LLALAAGSVYAACKLMGTLRLFREIGGASKVKKKELWRSCKIIVRKLGLKVPLEEPSAYVGRIAEALFLFKAVERKALAILEEVKGRRLLIGRIPQTVAAAAVYLAARLVVESVSQSEVAKAAQVTEVTVRNCMRVLERSLGIQGRQRLKSVSQQASS